MKYSFFFLWLLIGSQWSLGQSELTLKLEALHDSDSYTTIIEAHGDKVQNYEAKDIFLVGLAYYMMSDDAKTLKMMDLSIEKDPSQSGPYFYKGLTYYYMGALDKALTMLHKAIALDDESSPFYVALGDVYKEQGALQNALEAYITASQKEYPEDRAFAMIPQMYAQLNQTENALKAFYNAKNHIDPENNSYKIALYNIGLYEYLNANYDKALAALQELLAKDPDDFTTMTKLIQVYYAKEDFEKAQPLKDALYKAHEAGRLPDHLKERFCFDQFSLDQAYVFVYEYYRDAPKALFYKHVFYVTDKASGATKFTIQTENSPVSIELGGSKYILGMDKGRVHYNLGIGLDAPIDYKVLKTQVMERIHKIIAEKTNTGKD